MAGVALAVAAYSTTVDGFLFSVPSERPMHESVRYCENGALSIDNSLSERMVRPVAIGRKNYLFMGGKAAAVLYSIMASAKANQIEPFTYVRDLLDQLSRATPPEAAALLPDTWLAAHPQARRCWSR